MKYEAVRFRYTRCSLLIHWLAVNFSKKLVASTLYLWYTCSIDQLAVGNLQFNSVETFQSFIASDFIEIYA